MRQRRRATKKITMAEVDIKSLGWSELKTLAKSRGISTHHKKREQLEREVKV